MACTAVLFTAVIALSKRVPGTYISVGRDSSIFSIQLSTVAVNMKVSTSLAVGLVSLVSQASCHCECIAFLPTLH